MVICAVSVNEPTASAAEPVRSWSGIVQETVVEGEAASPS